MAAAAGVLALGLTDLESGWFAVLAGVIGTAALALTVTGSAGRWILVVNGLACLALGWSLMESTPVMLSLRGDRIQARAGGELVQARDGRYPAGGLEVWQAGAETSRAQRALPEALRVIPGLDVLLGPLYSSFRSGVMVLSLETDGTTNARPGVIWQLDQTRQDRLLDGSARDVSLQLSALRSQGPFAVLARENEGESYRMLAQPESRDLSLGRVRDGRLVQELENRGSPYRKDWAAALQSVLRELSRTWLVALLIPTVAAFVVGPPRPASRSVGQPVGVSLSATRRGIGVALLSVLALGITSWIAVEIFDGVPHERDSVAYLFQARLFSEGLVKAPAPGLPEFFKEDFIVQHQGFWFGKYPPGHPLVLAVGLLAGVPWLVGPVLGALAVGLLGILGSRLYGNGVAVTAALLLTISPFFLFMSGSYLAHPTALVLALGAMLAYLAVVGEGGERTAWARRIGSPLILGLLLGALLTTRQLTGAALAVCLGLWLMLEPGRSWRDRLEQMSLVALGALPPLLFLLWFQQATTGSPLLSPQLLWWEFDKIGFGPGVGAEGWHDPAMGLHDTWDRLTELQRHLFGWPFYLTLAPAMIPFILGRATRADWWLLSLVVALVGTYVLYWNRGMAYGPRYYYEALGPLCLLTARGFDALWTSVERGARFRASHWLPAALVAFTVLIYLPQQAREYRGYLGVDGRRSKLVRDAGIERGLVFVRDEPRGSWQAYASVFWLNSPTLNGPIIYARDRGADENMRLHATLPDRPAYLLSQGALTLVGER